MRGRALGVGQVGAEVHHARLAGAMRARQLGDALAVGEHQAGGAQAARDRLGARPAAIGGVQHVSAVHGDDQRDVGARPGAPRRTASPAGTALWAWTRSNGNVLRSRRRARPSVGAAHAPQVA